MIVPREKEEKRRKEKTERRKKSEICARRVKLRHVYRKGKKRERGKETWACTCSPDIDTPFFTGRTASRDFLPRGRNDRGIFRGLASSDDRILIEISVYFEG